MSDGLYALLLGIAAVALGVAAAYYDRRRPRCARCHDLAGLELSDPPLCPQCRYYIEREVMLLSRAGMTDSEILRYFIDLRQDAVALVLQKKLEGVRR